MGQRLFAIDMFALAHRGDAHVGMVMIRSGAKNRIDGLLLFQHRAEILKIGDFVIRCFLGKMLFDFRFDREPPSFAFEIESAQVLNFNRVRDGDYLDIGLLKQRPNIGLSLATAADNRQIDLFARGDEFRTAQDVARNQAESCDRSGGTRQKLSASEAFLFHS